MPWQPPEYYRRVRIGLKARGICTRCRIQPAAWTHTKCRKCLQDDKEYYRRRVTNVSI